MSDRNPQINKPLIAAGIAGLCILTALITAFFITLFLRMGKDEDTESKKEKKTTSSVSESEESESEKAEPGEQMSAETDAGGQAYQMLMSLDDLSDDEVEDIYREILDAYKEAWRDDFDNYDDVNINPNMTKSELGIPKNLSYAFIDFADDGFPELVVANVDKNGYKVLDLVGIEVDLQSPDQTKTAKRIFDQFPSKSFNLTGLRLSYLIGNPSIVGALKLLRSQYDFGISYPAQKAAIAALTGPMDEVRAQCDEYQRRRDAICGGLRRIGWDAKDSQGTMFTWIKVPEGYTSESCISTLLETCGVVGTPGTAFGPKGEGYIRFALVKPVEELNEIVDIIGKNFPLHPAK